MDVILALANFQIVGCLDAAHYEGAEFPWPTGWKELLDRKIEFDQIDTELPDESANAFIDKYKPADAQGDSKFAKTPMGRLKEKNRDLFDYARQVIAAGWDVVEDVEVSPLMIAAALEKKP